MLEYKIRSSCPSLSSLSWIWSTDNWARLSKISCSVSGERINYLPKPRQKIDLRDTDKSRYFAITEFNNYFIIRSPFFWSAKYVKSLSACSGNRSAILTQERSFNDAWAECICSKTLICRQLFAGHVVSYRPMKRKEKIHRMINLLVCACQLLFLVPNISTKKRIGQTLDNHYHLSQPVTPKGTSQFTNKLSFYV